MLQALRFLGGPFLTAQPEMADQILRLLLDHVMLPAWAQPLTLAAVSAARTASHPLTQGNLALRSPFPMQPFLTCLPCR